MTTTGRRGKAEIGIKLRAIGQKLLKTSSCNLPDDYQSLRQRDWELDESFGCYRLVKTSSRGDYQSLRQRYWELDVSFGCYRLEKTRSCGVGVGRAEVEY